MIDPFDRVPDAAALGSSASNVTVYRRNQSPLSAAALAALLAREQKTFGRSLGPSVAASYVADQGGAARGRPKSQSSARSPAPTTRRSSARTASSSRAPPAMRASARSSAARSRTVAGYSRPLRRTSVGGPRPAGLAARSPLFTTGTTLHAAPSRGATNACCLDLIVSEPIARHARMLPSSRV